MCITCRGLRGACAAGVEGFLGLFGCGLPEPAIGPWGSSIGHSDRQGVVLLQKDFDDYEFLA